MFRGQLQVAQHEQCGGEKKSTRREAREFISFSMLDFARAHRASHTRKKNTTSKMFTSFLRPLVDIIVIIVCSCAFKFSYWKLVVFIMLPSIGLRSLAPPLGTWFASYITCWKVLFRSIFLSHPLAALVVVSSPLRSLSRSIFVLLPTLAMLLLAQWKNQFHCHLFFHFLSLIYLIPRCFFTTTRQQERERMTNDSRKKRKVNKKKRWRIAECWTMCNTENENSCFSRASCKASSGWLTSWRAAARVQCWKIHLPFIIIK